MLLKKIVVAEDDDAIAHMVSMAMGDAGYLCLRARDGDEALRLVKAHDPDLLILDVMMPKVDGLEVARRLKSDVMWSRTPILMLTALSGVDSEVQGLDAGADSYMAKPFDLREFSARVRALIRGARRERDRNPTTDLPGSRAIDEEIDSVLRGGKDAAVVHIDLLGFDPYADAIGFGRAEQMVRALGHLVVDTARSASGGGAFIGHVGGSDFIAIVSAEHAEPFAQATIDAFSTARATLVPAGEDAAEGAAGGKLHVVIAVTSMANVTGGADEVARRLGVAMKQAKARGTSGYVVWSV